MLRKSFPSGSGNKHVADDVILEWSFKLFKNKKNNPFLGNGAVLLLISVLFVEL